MIDLNPVHLAIVTDILAEHVPTYEVRAFGSRATWTAKDHSDLDLVIIGDEPLPTNTLSCLREALEESPLPIRVDVLDWHTIPESWQEEISKNSLEVQEAASFTRYTNLILDDCITINDSTISAKHIPQYINYLDTSNITENRIKEIQYLIVGKDKVPTRARRQVQKGDLVYSTVRPNQRHFGILKDIPDNFLASTGFAVIRGKSGVALTDFVYWFLTQEHIVEYLQAIGEHSTSTYPSIRPQDIAQLPIHLPPLDEQRRIAHILGTLDDRIELNRRMSKTLEEMAQALFRSWFVNFDPVHAKAEGRPSGLPPDLDTLFPSSFQESELGPIPKGWKVKSLDEIAVFTNGLALQRFPPHDDDWLPVIKIAEMKRGYSQNTSKASASIDPKYIVEDGDLLFSWSGSLEIVLWANGQGALNQHLFKVTSCEFPLWFYRGWIANYLEHFRQIAASKATTMGHIQRHHLTGTKVVIPPQDTVFKSNCYLATLTEQEVRTAVQARTLAAQRDKLLPPLVSGKLRTWRAK